MKKIIIIILIILHCKGVSNIERKDIPKCCQILYDMSYLVQESKAVNLQSLLDCCRIEEKINFCNKQSKPDECLQLMKTF